MGRKVPFGYFYLCWVPLWSDLSTHEAVNTRFLTKPECAPVEESEFFIDDIMVEIHFIIVMIRWTGLSS